MTRKDKIFAGITALALIGCLKLLIIDSYILPSDLKTDLAALKTAAEHIQARRLEIGRLPANLEEAQLREKVGDNPLAYFSLNNEFIISLKRIDDTLSIDQNLSIYTTHPFTVFDASFGKNLKFYLEWMGYKMPWLGGLLFLIYSYGLWYFSPRLRLPRALTKKEAATETERLLVSTDEPSADQPVEHGVNPPYECASPAPPPAP